MTWFDSTSGAPSEFRGSFDGDVLHLVHERPHGGFSRCSFDCGLPGEYVFTMEVSPDGTVWTPAIEGAYGLLSGPAPGERRRRVAAKAASKRATRSGATARKRAPKAARKSVAKARTRPAAARAKAKAGKTRVKPSGPPVRKKAPAKTSTRAAQARARKSTRRKG